MDGIFLSSAFKLSSKQLWELLPFLFLTAGFLVAVLAAGVKSSARTVRWLGIIVFTLGSMFWVSQFFGSDQTFLGLHISRYSRFVAAAVNLFALIAVVGFDLAKRYTKHPEWLPLFILCVLGLVTLPCATDWISFFVFLELFSIPAYLLVGFDVEREHSLEASTKYLLTGSFASALLLMGIAIVYLASGSTDFLELNQLFDNSLATMGIFFILAGVFFKLTCVPFHFWAPDVYQGAPTGVAAFLAAGTKLSIFVAVAAAFRDSEWISRVSVHALGTAVASLSIIFGSLLAFTQRSFRRMLTYSGTVNAGYVVLLMTSGQVGTTSGLFFLFVYGITVLIVLSAFSALLKKRNLDPNSDLDQEYFSSADGKNSPWACGIMALGLISLAGIPPLPGFFVKYWIFSDLWLQGDRVVVILGLLSTLLGVAYYIRLAGKFYFAGSSRIPDAPLRPGSPNQVSTLH